MNTRAFRREKFWLVSMALNKAIQFSHLVNQLTRGETTQILTKLTNERSDILTKALFEYLKLPSIDEDAKYIKSSIFDIIEARKQNSKQPAHSETCKLDLLARPLIGVVASFLEQTDYFSLAQTNRAVYLGCTSPVSLRELQFMQFEAFENPMHLCNHLEYFKQVRALILGLDHIHDFKFEVAAGSALNALHTVRLNIMHIDIDSHFVDTFSAMPFNLGGVTYL